ncbi:hypothetical protein [Xenorhabdus bovienii]|uniref:Uncharacterized protein n=1 Tax=Xenorhabdus bovienii str. feltiae Moldova TaxID=1398200 RepID=A0A077NML7_XENBV|nr:hypothetical protein [Xenorhabdus bovienii]CDG99819.1 conserved hypothetical protein [Xenorhabdus bovienii str. feltiae Moldova]
MTLEIMEIKPIFINGAPLLDGDFNPVRVTKNQARKKAGQMQSAMRKKSWGKSAVGIVCDAGAHFNVSVGFPEPNKVV